MWGLFLLDYGKAPRRAARKPPDRALIDPFLLSGCPAVHDSHKGLAPAAQNFRQQDAVEKKRRHEEKIVDARVREIASRRG